MMPAAPPPEAALAEATRAGRWAEVRTLAAALPGPLAPEVALAAARASRMMGEPARALELLRAAIPRAGELAPALRLEAAAAAGALGRDPFPLLAPLLARVGPPAPRRAAEKALRSAWETAPLAALRRVPRGALPRPLRRDLAAVFAVRGGDRPAALRVVGERVGDRAALRCARWLSAVAGLPPAGALTVGEALLAGGAWREADAWLTAQPRPVEEKLRSRWAFLRGRAAYRLGDLDRAASAFDDALAAATSDGDRFAAAVQRARASEIAGDPAAAVAFWDRARAAAPREVEGWDGGARTRAAAGRPDEAIAVLRSSPTPVARVAVPRLAALLLARGDRVRSRAALAQVPGQLPAVRVLSTALSVADGDLPGARVLAAGVLADPSAGAWREMVLDLLPENAQDPQAAPSPSRDPGELARAAAERGADAARDALATALAADPSWTALLTGAPRAPAAWAGPARRLVAVGLERDAAIVFPDSFPRASPEEIAWTAARLAEWGNPPAALTAGERLREAAGALPAVLLPRRLLRHVLPSPLVAACEAAATADDVSPGWLIGIVRQESRFDADAYSPAGAVGVAQLVPEAALRLGASPDDLHDPTLALRLAAREVRRLGTAFGPRLAAVAAAYNAGDAVVASWLSELGGHPADAVFAAAVPYRETAAYVLAVREGAELAAGLAPSGARAPGHGAGAAGVGALAGAGVAAGLPAAPGT